LAVSLGLGFATPADAEPDKPASLPTDAARISLLSGDGVTAYQSGDLRALWLVVDPVELADGDVTLPRCHAPIRAMGWKDDSDRELKFVPEPERWRFSWNEPPRDAAVIEVVFEHPVDFPVQPPVAKPAADGSVMLQAYQATTHGEKLRYEPQWYKNTVGYWTLPGDYAEWDLVIDQPGTFSVAVLQGCGAGHGGSEAMISLHGRDGAVAKLNFEVLDTGHFQNFRWRSIGFVEVDQPGEYRLRITPKRIAKAALCDIRCVHLVRQAKPISGANR
jgi:hypothetical protein